MAGKFLSEIIELKKKRLETAKSRLNIDEIKDLAEKKRLGKKKFHLQQSLKKKGINIIAEIKRGFTLQRSDQK